ncbi:Hsp70 family protein [Actinophytocola sp.]|uniref:Hsp70 family protein n=1 Tax=Actinophytocola sp. TaxID=1872138 RepID=UPI002D44A8B0|nr:Hsp70 family protein [Actinophytocola sp.]HYQ66827.1 Hsp70 family protein [Actinophytocola sp.]
MRYGVGIDLGTSFTSAAISGPHGTHMVPLSPAVVVPSVAYPAPDGTVLTGPAALAAAADPARVARGFKRRLGDPTPLVLGGAGYSPATLMAAQLRDVLATVTRYVGAPPTSIVLTCPAIWGPYRREQFAEVPKLVGVPEFRLITEPEAAATHYSAERRLGDGEVVAVYDLGGGTFDTTILRMRSGDMEILGVPEGIEHMGGTDFDETLLAHVDDRLDGAVSGLDTVDPAAATVVAEIRAMCVRAKEELSVEPDVTLTVPLPAGPRELTITRLEFNDMIRPSVKLTTDALRRTISSAGIRPDDLSAVLLAGGSSRIPLVSQLVSQEFGKPVRMTLHPKLTVALGAAAIATRTSAVPLMATPAPDPEPAFPKPRPRFLPRKRLVPLVAAGVAVVVAAVTTVLLVTGGLSSGSTATPRPQPMRVFDTGVVKPWIGFIASAENWGGTEIGTTGAQQGPIAARLDGKGLRVTWRGTAGQVYLQADSGTRDLTSYVDHGALVFDVVVHEPPTAKTEVAVHCVYPCGAEVPVTELLRKLGPEKKSTVKIPVACFTAAGLDPKRVNTPFLVYTDKPFDATFSAVRWDANAAADRDAVSCGNLH